MKLLQIVAGLMFLAVSVYYMAIMFSVANIANSVFGYKNDPLGGAAKVHNARHQSHGPLKDGYVALTDSANIEAGRVVTITLPVAVKDVLKSVGAPADRDMQDVYLSGQAPKLAEAECALLRQSIAAECRINWTRAKTYRDDPDHAEISMQLAFTEKQSPGEFDLTAALNYQEADLDLVDLAGLYPETWLSEFRRKRTKLYLAAGRACKAMRRQAGNCSVTGIRISGRWDTTEEIAFLSSSATLSTLWPAGN